MIDCPQTPQVKEEKPVYKETEIHKPVPVEVKKNEKGYILDLEEKDEKAINNEDFFNIKFEKVEKQEDDEITQPANEVVDSDSDIS